MARPCRKCDGKGVIPTLFPVGPLPSNWKFDPGEGQEVLVECERCEGDGEDRDGEE